MLFLFSAPPSRQIFAFCAFSVGAWTLIPLIFFPNPPLDVVIALAWGRDFAWGYTQHPPLLSWLLAGADSTLGSALGSARAAYFLSGLCLALSHLLIWVLAGRFGLSDRQRIVAILINSATFYTTLAIPEFNHNVIQIPLWLGLIWLFHRSQRENNWADWLALGLVAGAGLLAKYSVILLLGSIGLYALIIPAARRSLVVAKPYAAALIALMLFAPHLSWMLETDFLTLRYASDRTSPAEGLLDHLLHPLDFLFGQIAALAPCLVVLGAAFYTAKRSTAHANLPEAETALAVCGTVSRADALFIYWFLFTPLGTVLFASLLTGNEFRHMWGMPMFGLLGIALVACSWRRQQGARLLPLWIAAWAVQLVFLAVLLGQALIEPLWKTKPSRIHYPGAEIAQVVTAAWQHEIASPLRFVAGDIWTAGNVVVFSPDKPSVFVDHDLDRTPWVDGKDIEETGLVAIWRGGAADQPPWFERYAAVNPIVRTRTFAQPSWVRDAPPITISWAVIAPKRDEP